MERIPQQSILQRKYVTNLSVFWTPVDSVARLACVCSHTGYTRPAIATGI